MIYRNIDTAHIYIIIRAHSYLYCYYGNMTLPRMVYVNMTLFKVTRGYLQCNYNENHCEIDNIMYE